MLKDTPAQAVIADKVYDAHARLIRPLLVKGKTVVIPSRATNKQQRELARRWSVPGEKVRTWVSH